jgi:poly(3-hydroxybutyrate) depolymerase
MTILDAKRSMLKPLGFATAMVISLAAREAGAEYVGNKYTEPGTGLVLEYNIFVPANYDASKKYPLMLVMHAANNDAMPHRTLASDGKGWAETFVNSPHQATDPSFFMIPISQTNASGWGDPLAPITAEQKFEGRLAVKVLKEVVLSKYSIDAQRLYVTGPSMGGRGTWDMLRRNPTLFAAAAPAAAPARPEDAALYLSQNIWAVCGEKDPIVQGERATIVAIRALGGNPIYTELAGHGHDSWRNLYPDPAFLKWMYAQRLGVPWWTVSSAPTGVMNASLTPGWPPTVPPKDLPTSFGGASGTAGSSSAGSGSGGGSGGTASGGTVGAETGGTNNQAGGAAPFGSGVTLGTAGASTGGTAGTASAGQAGASASNGGTDSAQGGAATGGNVPGAGGAASGGATQAIAGAAQSGAAPSDSDGAAEGCMYTGSRQRSGIPFAALLSAAALAGLTRRRR